MPITLHPVRSQQELEVLAGFSWRINRDDPCWVPPSFDDLLLRLDAQKNAFWKTAEREFWLARSDGKIVGTIGAVIDRVSIAALGRPVGKFGFFECVPDADAARALSFAAEDWLRLRGMHCIRGPYNPTADDSSGILIEGFHTRPAILEAHNPPYYASLFETCGYSRYNDLVARIWKRPPGSTFSEMMPEKLARVAERAARRSDLRVRGIDRRRWSAEIDTAWAITCDALAGLPEYVPIRQEEFHALASAFRRILDPRMALLAEIGGEPVGFVLALPDLNEALQKVSRRSQPRKLRSIDLLRILWLARRCRRATLKLLMVKPAFQGRGVEAVLIAALARSIWERGFEEVDMSLTGDENEKSSRFQENLGFQIYRRYRIYEKELLPNV